MKHFIDGEFRCPCCDKNEMDKKFKEKIDKARGIANIPFIISSGYRCKAHNFAVGGTATSSHLKGLAVDIEVEGSRQRFKILTALLAVGINRIGVGKNFIHADNDPDKSKCVIWVY